MVGVKHYPHNCNIMNKWKRSDDCCINKLFVGFIPFGEVVGDSIGPRLDDASMLIGTLEVPIVYYQEEERVIYVKHMYI